MYHTHVLSVLVNVILFYYFFQILFIYFERGEGKDKEKHQCVAASCAPPTGDLASNPGMCPDWELNQRPFDLQSGTQSTEPHQPGLVNIIVKNRKEIELLPREQWKISSAFFRTSITLPFGVKDQGEYFRLSYSVHFFPLVDHII